MSVRLELLKRGIPHDSDGVAGDARLDEHFRRAHGPANPRRELHTVYTRAISTSVKADGAGRTTHVNCLIMFDSFKPARGEAAILSRRKTTLPEFPTREVSSCSVLAAFYRWSSPPPPPRSSPVRL